MRNIWKKGVAVLLAATMIFGAGISAFASEEDGDEIQGSLTTEEVTVDEGDKPYIAFGADLSSDEKATVLELFGISADDLDQYEVVNITNEQEHKYLDSYLDSSTIGTRALSSVVVMQGEKGSGISVTTKNITYCTVGMYENALATAGLEDAEVIVAGPFPISGTAALIGAVEAYSVMTGDEVDENVIDGAIDEMVITGELEEETGSTEELEGMIAYLKEQVADKNLSDSELQDAVEQASEQFNVTLTQEQIDELIALLKKLQGLDLNWDSLKNQAQSVYDKLQNMGIDVNTDELVQQAQGFFAKLIAWIKSLFQ
jgi:uncharacterized protein YpuA (DUF1002 family)